MYKAPKIPFYAILSSATTIEHIGFLNASCGTVKIWRTLPVGYKAIQKHLTYTFTDGAFVIVDFNKNHLSTSFCASWPIVFRYCTMRCWNEAAPTTKVSSVEYHEPTAISTVDPTWRCLIYYHGTYHHNTRSCVLQEMEKGLTYCSHLGRNKSRDLPNSAGF